MKGRIIFGENGARDRYYLDNKEVSRKQFKDEFPDRDLGTGDGLIGWHRPIVSDALAVHPQQIAAVLARNKKHGITTEYAPDGRPILRSREERRRLMAVEGCHDRNGGFGDDTPAKGGYLGVAEDTADFGGLS